MPIEYAATRQIERMPPTIVAAGSSPSATLARARMRHVVQHV